MGEMMGNLNGKPRRIWEDNTRTDLQALGFEGVDCSIWPRIGISGVYSEHGN
jgi:hypothetical protein